MKMKLPKQLLDYFKNERNLAISVNKISEYLSLDKIKQLNLRIDLSKNILVEVNIDETELDSVLLKDETLFSIVAIYAMAIGE